MSFEMMSKIIIWSKIDFRFLENSNKQTNNIGFIKKVDYKEH